MSWHPPAFPRRGAAWRIVRHGVAALLALGAVLATRALLALGGAFFFVGFPAIVSAGWMGGTGPALTCAALYTLGAAWLLPPDGLLPAGPRDAYRLLGVLLSGALVAAVTGRLRAATRRERGLREAAEREASARGDAERAARTSEERTRTLQALTAALSAAHTREDVARALLEEGLPALGARGGGLWYRAEPARLVLQAGHALGLGRDDGGRDLPLDAPAPAATAARTGAAVWLDGLDAPARDTALADRPAARAWAAIPLTVEGETLGALELCFAAPHAFTAGEREAIASLASVTAQAYERARLYEAERTARRRAEAAEEASLRASQLQEQLLAVVGHDLRTPLSAILLSATSLRRQGRLDDRQGVAVDRITRSTSRMSELIRDLLDLVRIRQGLGLSVTLRPLEAAELCRQAIAELEEIHPGRAIVLDAAGIAPLEADPGRVLQAVSNLIGNALQHGAEDGAVRVRVERPGDEVRIAVTNRGPPIPPRLAAELFEPFRRGAAPGGAGLGLGLFIAREIARAHGGEVELRSDAQEGTTFTLRLPASAAARAGSDAA